MQNFGTLGMHIIACNKTIFKTAYNEIKQLNSKSNSYSTNYVVKMYPISKALNCGFL
jgi:hypothetical protein